MSRPTRVAFRDMSLRHTPLPRWPNIIRKEMRGFLQRGWRGWADQDAWSLDLYLAAWLPDAVRVVEEAPTITPELDGLANDLEILYPWLDWDYDLAEDKAMNRKVKRALKRFTKNFGRLWW